MKIEEFTDFLSARVEEYEWAEGAHDGKDGIFVRNKLYDEETHYTNSAITVHDINTLLAHSRQGKNIEKITRVTGFFSKVGSWNKGKTGELSISGGADSLVDVEI